MFQSRSTTEEVANLTRFIVNKVVEEGYRYRDFSVIVTDGLVYNDEVRRVFTENSVPFFLDEKKPLLQNTIVRFLVSLCVAFAENLRREELFAALKFGFTPLTTDQINALEVYAKKRKLGWNVRDEEYFREKFYAGGKDAAVPKKSGTPLRRLEKCSATCSTNSIVRREGKRRFESFLRSCTVLSAATRSCRA